MAMMADFALRRTPPPELAHRHGAELVKIGILQKFGRRALSGSAGRDASFAPEHFVKTACLSTGAQQLIAVEEALLQGCRATVAFGSP